MSAREIVARICHLLMSNAGQLGLFTAKRPAQPEIRETSRWLHIGEVLHSPFYTRAADRLIDGTAPVFALRDREVTGIPEWNRDPLSGVLAPLKFGPSLDIHSPMVVGNIKYLWEPNRHLDLTVLAQAFERTGSPKYLHGIKVQLESWFDQCPYMMGPNWNSGLELAIRLINWSIVWQLIGAARSPIFDGEEGKRFQERWLQSIYQHAHFIRGNYSQFSSANNHLIGEAAGNFIAACTWPYWKEFDRWGEEAMRLLINAASEQTHGDGVNREQAISYQQFVLDFFILSGLAGRARDLEFPQEYWRLIERMIEYIQAIMDVGGNVPMIGDADDGFVVGLSQEPGFCPYKSLLASGAILFGRPDFAAKSGGLDDKTRILLGDNWRGIPSLRVGGACDNRGRHFPEGGYYILGEGLDTSNEIRLLVDCGPLGHLSIAAHGHADALAVYLSVAGREFLIDPGTYTYHGKPEWRAYFRGTRAHNTVTLDGQDQSVQGGSFMWTDHGNARCTEFIVGTDRDAFIGEHDGYTRLGDPVIHERSISRTGTLIEIIDMLKCRGSHSVERGWHFSEKCNITVIGSQVYAENDGVKICLSADNPMTKIVCLRESDEPIGGWVSRSFDVKLPATSVYFLDQIEGTTAISASIQCRLR
jgi:hypothetical protein